MNPHFPLKIYFGPVTTQPSWYWVGRDVAEYLGSSADVKYFNQVDDIEDGSIVFWIKCPPPQQDSNKLSKKNLVILFFPVDSFMNLAQITENFHFIEIVSLICLHSCSLRQYFPARKVVLIDHYNKFGIEASRRRSRGKKLLWIGGYQYVPYVVNELDSIHWDHKEITLLTNAGHGPAYAAAERNAASIGLTEFRRRILRSGLKVVEWSEDRQEAELLTCAAAFDVKYLSCFNQQHKPPTKLQKYIASGIPCAANENFVGAKQVEGVLSLTQLWQTRLDTDYLARLTKISRDLTTRLSLAKVARRYFELACQAVEFRNAEGPQTSVSTELHLKLNK